MKRFIAAIFLSALAVSIAFSLDVRDGIVRIKVDDMSGHVTLYRLVTVKGSLYEPLVFDTDARTSSLLVSIDGRKTKLGDSQDFKISVRKTNTGAEVEYASPNAILSEKIDFIRSADSRVSNGFKVSYEVKNLSARDFKVRIRQIWDTRLGEKAGLHFATDKASRIEEEQKFTRESEESFVASPGETASLALLLKKLERPDIVIIANWKRISDATWYYDTLQKGFTMAPYSVNDSALGLYWDDTIIKAGLSKTFSSYFLTGGTGVEFLRQLAEKGYDIAGEAAPKASKADAKKQLSLDIEALRKLLVSLDSAIEDVDNISDDDVNLLLQQVETMQKSSAQL